eukprot:2111954-Alexandrium_andersonii.AAC.1
MCPANLPRPRKERHNTCRRQPKKTASVGGSKDGAHRTASGLSFNARYPSDRALKSDTRISYIRSRTGNGRRPTSAASVHKCGGHARV